MTPPSVLDVYLSPSMSVTTREGGTVAIVADHAELNLRWPASMSPADRAAKCAALAAVFTTEGMRQAVLDESLVPQQRGPYNTPPVPAPRKSGETS